MALFFHIDKKALLDLIESIDAEMRQQNIPIHARPLRGAMRLADRLKIKLMLAPPDEITRLVSDWFKEKYGDRLKVDFSPGDLAFLLRNDLFRFKFPKIWGRFTVKAELESFNQRKMSFEAAKRPKYLEINPLHYIVDLTETYVRSLTLSELEEISKLFKWALDLFELIRAAASHNLVKEAMGDLHAAVANLFTIPPHYGQSKWASQQATEKLLKAYIEKKGKEPKHVHDIQKLADYAHSLGMVRFRSDEIEKIQCPAGVRYGDICVSLLETIEAHHASLNICAGTALIMMQE